MRRVDDAAQVAQRSEQPGGPTPVTALVHRRQAIAASPRPALRVAAEPGAATGLLGRIRVERRRMIEAGEPAEIVALAVDAGAAWTGP